METHLKQQTNNIMNTKTLTQEQQEELRKPLPDEAVSVHPTKPYLSSIKAIYVTERFNEVFGIGGWTAEARVIDANEGAPVVYVTFTAPEYGITLSQFGGNDNGGTNAKNYDLGDAYKGAMTDALTKIASYMDVGADVFKGLQKGDGNTAEKKAKSTPKPKKKTTKKSTPPPKQESSPEPEDVSDDESYIQEQLEAVKNAESKGEAIGYFKNALDRDKSIAAKYRDDFNEVIKGLS